MSSNYNIIENTSSWLVVELTVPPTHDIAGDIADINSTISPIVVTAANLEEARQIFGDNFGLVAANNVAKYGKETFAATSQRNAVKWLKAMMQLV